MSKVSNPDLFKAVSEAVAKYGEKGLIPDSYISVGASLYRGIDNQYVSLTPDGLITNLCANSVITPRDGEIDLTKEINNNRFSGINPLPNEGKLTKLGGLYLFRDENAGLAEMMHYSEKMESLPINIQTRRISIPHLMATKAVFTIYPRKSLRLANLSIHRDGANVTKFMNAIEDTPAIKNLLHGAKLIDKLLDPADYSVSRAFAFACADIPYFDGLESQTARDSDRPGWIGDNVCVFGKYMTPIPFLNPDLALLTFSSSSLYNGDGKQLKLSDKDENILNRLSPDTSRSSQTLKVEVENALKFLRY